MDGFRSLSIGLAMALLLTGPLAPVAWAQQPQQPMLYEEAMKATKAAEPSLAHQMGAVAVNAAYVPGKVALCALGTGVALLALSITLGSGYRTAARLANEGCGGPWIVTGKDLKAALEEEGPGRPY